MADPTVRMREALLRDLLERSVVTAAEIARAEMMAERNHLPVEHVLNQMGVLSDEDLVKASARAARCAVWDSGATPPQDSVDDLSVSRDFLRRHRLLPIHLDAGRLTVAACDPLDGRGLAGLAFATGKAIDVLAAAPSEWRRVFAERYAATFEAPIDVASRSLDRELDRLADASADSTGARTVSTAIEAAVERGASDIHFEPRRHDARVRLRLDGRLIPLGAVSLEIAAGESFGIVGESGSGKTTLGRLILRTVEPTSGTITYNDGSGRAVDVTALSKRDLRAYHRDVRLVFQDPFASLNPRMTAKEVIGDPLFVAGLARGAALERRVGELMELVGLDPQSMERYPHAFSGGQRQRIGIARALALDPRVIIADEATAALDVSIRAQILDLLLDIQKRLSLSFIFISHDISVVRYFCDRVAVMHRGKVVETGSAEQICTAPRETYTQSLISAVPNPDPRHKRMLHRTRFSAEATP